MKTPAAGGLGVLFTNQVDQDLAFTVTSPGATSPFSRVGTRNGALAFGVGGEQMRIAADGSVGIGTTTPAAPLEVKTPAGGGLGALFSNHVDQDIAFTVTAPGAPNPYSLIGPRTAGALAFGIGGGEQMRIASSGNIGVGTTAPAYKFDVNGYIRTMSGLVFPNGTIQTTAAVGTITGVSPGTGLSGGGYGGNVSLAVDSTVARTNAVNVFNGNQILNNGIQVAGGMYIYNNYNTDIIEAVCPFGYCLVFEKTRGDMHISGTFYPLGSDFAESVNTSGDQAQYGPGDILGIDPSGTRVFTKVAEPYSRLVAGIYATNPGVLASRSPMNSETLAKEVPLAVVGIVPCKVTDENGPIFPGDLIVTSSIPGFGMKGSDPNKLVGAVVGKALQALPAGKGAIEVLVSLQ